MNSVQAGYNHERTRIARLTTVGGGPNHERSILTSVGMGLDLIRKLTPNIGKRNGTSRVPYDTIALPGLGLWEKGYGEFDGLDDGKALTY